MANSAPPGRLLAFDLETTGLEPRRDAIVAVGCVPVEERTILWGRAYRALVDDPRSLRPRDLDALGTHQVLPEEQRGGLGHRERVDIVGAQLGAGTIV
ncbi:MAG: polymerase subunit epsilon, partial [Acidobacteriota bacterium]|nr:polymerase subunit epsilon [Acidobacteriota bacterium]